MKKKNILLLGVTGGVGRAVADRLLADGFDVIVTCRTEKQKTELEAEGKFRAVLIMTLSSDASIEAAFSGFDNEGIESLHAVINCAARLHATPLEIVSREEADDIFQINLFGTLRVVQLALPMLRENRGRVILVGSLAGSFVMPMMGIYSASKFALEALVDALRRELYPWDIKVSLIKPGAIDTKMFQGHLLDISAEKQQLKGKYRGYYTPLYEAHEKTIPKTRTLAVSVENVARDVMKALYANNPASRYHPGIDSKLTGKLVGIIPDRVLDWFSSKAFPLR